MARSAYSVTFRSQGDRQVSDSLGVALPSQCVPVVPDEADPRLSIHPAPQREHQTGDEQRTEDLLVVGGQP
jgi:hypothetical protein